MEPAARPWAVGLMSLASSLVPSPVSPVSQGRGSALTQICPLSPAWWGPGPCGRGEMSPSRHHCNPQLAGASHHSWSSPGSAMKPGGGCDGWAVPRERCWARLRCLSSSLPLLSSTHPYPLGGHLWANPFPGCCGAWPPGMEGLAGTAAWGEDPLQPPPSLQLTDQEIYRTAPV